MSGRMNQLALLGVPLTGGEGIVDNMGDRMYPGPSITYRPPGFRLEMAWPSCERIWPARTET